MARQLRLRWLKEFYSPKGFLRKFSSNILQTQELSYESNNHPVYKKKLTKNQTIQHLLDKVVYNKGGIVVTNKPYGLAIRQHNQLVTHASDFYLFDLLPQLAGSLGLSSPIALQTINRYASGLTILTESKNKEELLKNYSSSYLAVVVGRPIHEDLKMVFAIQRTLYKNLVCYELVETLSENNVNKGPIKVYNWNHKVLASSQMASLVRLNISKFEWLNIQTFFSTKCSSPVLGGMCTWVPNKHVISFPSFSNEQEIPKNEIQKLPQEIMSALEVSQEQVEMIPGLIHLESATVTQGDDVITFSVPPPESFVWTCEKLGLPLPTTS